jgi:hypothetical protein
MWPEPDSNQRHANFQSAALPTELSGRVAIPSLAGGSAVRAAARALATGKVTICEILVSQVRVARHGSGFAAEKFCFFGSTSVSEVEQKLLKMSAGKMFPRWTGGGCTSQLSARRAAISGRLHALSHLRRGRRCLVARGCPPCGRRGCSRGAGGAGVAKCWLFVPAARLRCIS